MSLSVYYMKIIFLVDTIDFHDGQTGICYAMLAAVAYVLMTNLKALSELDGE